MKEKYIFGIDLGGTTAKLGLFTASGALLRKWEIPTDTGGRGGAILKNLAASLQGEMRLRNIPAQSVQGAGLAIPGTVTDNRFVGPTANLGGWGNCDVAGAFSALCGLPVKVANDANAAALGEQWQGSAKGARSLLFVTLGTGVGGGVIVDDRIVEGAHGAGGEIGHLCVHPEEKRACGCGKHGCLEQYASATGLVYAAQTLLGAVRDQSLLRHGGEITAKEIFACAQQGDALAGRLVANFASELGRALATVACVTDPEVIVLGGGVSAAGKYLLDAVQEAYGKFALPATASTAFRLAALGNDAGMHGAARLMLA